MRNWFPPTENYASKVKKCPDEEASYNGILERRNEEEVSTSEIFRELTSGVIIEESTSRRDPS